MARNPAEKHLGQLAGTVPETLRGPHGVAYRVRDVGRYLVRLKRAVVGKATKKDLENEQEVASSAWMWTRTVQDVRRLVDPERYPWKACTCVKCRAKKVAKVKARKR